MKPHDAEFVAALLAPARDDSIPPEMDLYAPFLGTWKLAGAHFLPEGQKPVSGEVVFARVLGGRAIQDVWIFGTEGSGPPRAGTTVRVYDPVERAWNVTWLDPISRARVQLVARKVGGDIVQIGASADGKPRRWVFSDVAEDRFVWRGEHSDDDGRTWQLNAEYCAERTAGLVRSPSANRAGSSRAPS